MATYPEAGVPRFNSEATCFVPRNNQTSEESRESSSYHSASSPEKSSNQELQRNQIQDHQMFPRMNVLDARSDLLLVTLIIRLAIQQAQLDKGYSTSKKSHRSLKCSALSTTNVCVMPTRFNDDLVTLFWIVQMHL